MTEQVICSGPTLFVGECVVKFGDPVNKTDAFCERVEKEVTCTPQTCENPTLTGTVNNSCGNGCTTGGCSYPISCDNLDTPIVGDHPRGGCSPNPNVNGGTAGAL